MRLKKNKISKVFHYYQDYQYELIVLLIFAVQNDICAMLLKRVTELNAALADWDENKLPNGSDKYFSVAFITKNGEYRYVRRAKKAGLRFNMKENDMKALIPVDDEGNEFGHVYPVWIHAIIYYSGNIEYSIW